MSLIGLGIWSLIGNLQLDILPLSNVTHSTSNTVSIYCAALSQASHRPCQTGRTGMQHVYNTNVKVSTIEFEIEKADRT